MRFSGVGQGISTSECAEKSQVSNQYTWKHKDMSMLSYHAEASVKKVRLGSTEYYMAITDNHRLQTPEL